ncbi:MAG: hypothetical protein S4CHLAM45_07940 [Chlamydiales bacterium]|nr:hypothetical protein [Chlamydiales bacterium]MCH9619996.1 hypothetical protein [Chlamydiales bacterium]MCH9622900.1 hypothetical protein [Chlamydiales bacterium]
MATKTTTETLPSTLLLQQLNTPVDFVRELSAIQRGYEQWDDPLSIRIHTWVGEAIEDISSSERTEEVAQAAIDRLKEILSNQMDGSPLHHPILDRSWTWEKTDLDNYKKLSLLSPHDGKPFEAEEKEHLFAKAMLAWMQQSFQYLTSQKLVPFKAEGDSEKESQLRTFGYLQIAMNAAQIAQFREVEKAAHEAARTFENTVEFLTEEKKKEIERARRRVEKHHAIVEAKVEALAKAHTSITSKQAKELELREKEAEQVEKLLVAAKSSNAENSEQLEELRVQLAEAKAKVAQLAWELQNYSPALCVIL